MHKNRHIFLPNITEEIYEQFSGEPLIEFNVETQRPEWTQTAVEFICLLTEAQQDRNQQDIDPVISETGMP